MLKRGCIIETISTLLLEFSAKIDSLSHTSYVCKPSGYFWSISVFVSRLDTMLSNGYVRKSSPFNMTMSFAMHE